VGTAQPRIPAGDGRRGRIHPGEFAPEAETESAPRPRGRKSGSPVPASAPIHARTPTTGESAAQREAIAREHDSRLPEEMAGNFKCGHCGWAGWREHPVITREGKWHATLAMAGCTRCGTLHAAHVGVAGVHSPQHSTARKEAAKPSRRGAAATGSVPANGRASTRLTRSALGKTVDTSETALQGPAALEYVGHRLNCPRGGESPCGADVAGRCGLCDEAVQDHEVLGKTETVLLELRKLAGL
jgi:hypothetical protein